MQKYEGSPELINQRTHDVCYYSTTKISNEVINQNNPLLFFFSFYYIADKKSNV